MNLLMVGVEQSVQTDGGEAVWAQGDTFGRLLEGSKFGSLLTVSPTYMYHRTKHGRT